MPVPHGTGRGHFDGSPVVSCFGFCVKGGRLTEAVDLFRHPFWESVWARVADKALEIRRQGFPGAAMPPGGELEYAGHVRVLDRLGKRFTVRPAVRVAEAVAV
jgi:fructose 1,6-bisphosphate aldolase/phosphatase